MTARKGKYKGAELASLLADCPAILRPAGDFGFVLAQFDYMLAQGTARRPGEGVDEQLPYCFGWHRFPESVFEFERPARTSFMADTDQPRHLIGTMDERCRQCRHSFGEHYNGQCPEDNVD